MASLAGGTAPLAPLPFADLGGLIRGAGSTHGARTAFTQVMPNGMNARLTFAGTLEHARAFAAFLQKHGVAPGDRVAIQLPNSLAYPVAAFGTLLAGAVLVNVNPLYTADELRYQLEDSGARVLVVVDVFAAALPHALAGTAVERVVLTRITDFFHPVVGGVIRGVQRWWNRSLPEVKVPHVRFAHALAEGRAASLREVERGRDDLAALQYTGGTTGVSKGAMLTHGNLLANCAQMLAMAGSQLQEGKERILTALPLYHIFAFTVNLLGFWSTGNENVLIPSPRPPSNLRRAIENHGITWVAGVNTLFNALCNEFWFAESPPRTLRMSVAGGTALQGAVAERWRRLTGTDVVEGYGLTEASPVVTFNPFGAGREGSIGMPVPGTEVQLLDDAGRPVPEGQPGELCVRGPQVMRGYWNRADETAKVVVDGWLRTGDVAVRDPDGYLRIVDRKKDLILVSGFNVYPNEVEDVIARHPGVLEVAVIGVPDGAAGEAVKAYVVRRDPELTEELLRAHVREHLTGYKVPKAWEFRTELPKSPIGKILRKTLRAELAATAGGKAA